MTDAQTTIIRAAVSAAAQALTIAGYADHARRVDAATASSEREVEDLLDAAWSVGRSNAQHPAK